MKKIGSSLLNALIYLGLFVASFYLLFFIFVKIATSKLGMSSDEAKQYAALIFLVALSVTAVICFFIFKARKQSLIKVCNFSGIDLKSLVIILIGSYALVMFIECLVYLPSFGDSFPTLKSYVEGIGGMGVSIITFLIMFLTVLFEEIVFRGAIFGEMRSSLPKPAAIIAGAMFYGIANIVVGMGIPMGIGAFISAVFYILAYDAKRSLWAPFFVQVVCMCGMMFTLQTGISSKLASSGQGFLISLGIISILIAIGADIMLYKTAGTAEKNIYTNNF
jgi:uncharacterized protein